MSNVLINCVSAGSGGALAYLINLIPLLVDRSRDDDINIYVLLKKEQYELVDNIPIENVLFAPSLSGYRRFIWEHFNLPSLINKYDIDLIFTPYQIARIFKGVKNIVMFRNMEPFTFQKYNNALKNTLRNHILKYKTMTTLRNTDRVIAVSDYVKKIILNGNMTTSDKVERIYHGRDKRFNQVKCKDDKKVLLSIDIDSSYIFTCGSLFPYRKCEDIIRAYSKLDSVEHRLVIAGSSNDSAYINMLNQLVIDNNLTGSVKFVGHVALEVMISLYRNCDVFVTATETEACPNIAIEAMSSGCNIISSDVSPLPEMFGESARYYKHGDVDELTNALKEEINTNKGINDKALSIINSFSWNRCAGETYKLIVNELHR